MIKTTKDVSLSITLKRNVTLKAIVTEDFKKYLIFEMEEEVSRIESRLKAFDHEFAEYKKQMKGQSEQLAQVKQQSEVEITRFNEQVKQLKGRISEVKKLDLGTHFNQGTIEGFVNVKEGDNLYYKQVLLSKQMGIERANRLARRLMRIQGRNLNVRMRIK